MRIIILVFFLFFSVVNSENLEQKDNLNKLFNQLGKVKNSKTGNTTRNKDMVNME